MFKNEETEEPLDFMSYGAISGSRPDRIPIRSGVDRHMVSSIYTRLSIDVSGVEFNHIRQDINGRFEETIYSGLHNCLNVEANVDQAARAFRQDIAVTMFDRGVAAIVPVDTTLNPNNTEAYDIKTLRVGEITAWYPQHVQVSLYNEKIGRREDITLPKRYVAIVENPLYSVMNEPNSTLQRLVRKLSLLDAVDEQTGSNKMNMIIQLPYVIKSEARKKQAEQRREDIEFQLTQSKYGIAYTDGTEKIMQLNRPVENNLMEQIEYLTKLLYAQLGLTEEIMNGTASESVMLNYNNRTIKPVVTAISEAMSRTFLTKTARTQRQTITYSRDPFDLVPLNNIAEIADKFTRNEIMSANEVRSLIGMRPSGDPKADDLRNSNMPLSDTDAVPPGASGGDDVTNGVLDEIENAVNELFEGLEDDSGDTG